MLQDKFEQHRMQTEWFENKISRISGEFYKLVEKYCSKQDLMDKNTNDLSMKRNKIGRNIKNDIWQLTRESQTQTLRLLDGNNVNYTHKYNIAK